MILQDRRLAGAVGADDADLGAGIERHRDVVEDDLVAVRLAGFGHGVDELGHGRKAIGRKRSGPNSSAPASGGRPPTVSYASVSAEASSILPPSARATVLHVGSSLSPDWRR